MGLLPLRELLSDDDSHLRTLQRRLKQWRAIEGPSKEVVFARQHFPGELCASDFTHMESLNVTIFSQSFDHMAYHLVLTYSNWESITVCHSESLESRSEGLQRAFLWILELNTKSFWLEEALQATQQTSGDQEG